MSKGKGGGTIIAGGAKLLDLIPTDKRTHLKLEVVLRTTAAFYAGPIIKSTSIALNEIAQPTDGNAAYFWELYGYRKEWINVNPKQKDVNPHAQDDPIPSVAGPWRRAICFAGRPAQMYKARHAVFPAVDKGYKEEFTFQWVEGDPKDWSKESKITLREPETACDPNASFTWDEHDDNWVGLQYVKDSQCQTAGAPIINQVESGSRKWWPVETVEGGPGVICMKNQLYIHSLDFAMGNRCLFDTQEHLKGDSMYTVPGVYLEMLLRQRQIVWSTMYTLSIIHMQDEAEKIDGESEIKEVELTNIPTVTKALMQRKAVKNPFAPME